MMRRLQFIFLASLPLCRARSRSFNIHEDLLAFPQFEVIFADTFVSEKDATSLLDTNPSHSTYSADSAHPSIVGDAAQGSNAHGAEAKVGASGSPLTYELLNMPPHRYLCSIPEVQSNGPENQTAGDDLAESEEARRFSRTAAASGWELVNQLEDSCLYFMPGWWSYRFCNNREIVQFHALPSMPDGQLPRRDPHTAEYVLGRAPAISAHSETHAEPHAEPHAETHAPTEDDARDVPAELQTKGDQRYLVQRLGGGTICDVTGRERTIEVQYHCVPGLEEDRIGWIKEVTICSYVMVINTPRLCDDVTFLPPRETRASPITCQLIHDAAADGASKPPPLLGQGAVPQGDATAHAEQAKEEEEEQQQQQQSTDSPSAGLTIGGVVIGGRKVISAADQEGKPPAKLTPPRGYLANQKAAAAAQERLIEVLVHVASKEDGGKIDALSKEELEKLDLKPEVIEEMRQQMRDLAGENGWQLEVVELPGGGDLRELRGWIHEDEAAEEEDGYSHEKMKEDESKSQDRAKGKKGAEEDSKKKQKKLNKSEKKKNDDSEEKFFKEEL